MSTINSHFNPAIQLNPAATHQGATLLGPYPREEPLSELNCNLLKSLIVQLEKTGGGQIERIRSVLSQHNEDTSAADFSASKLHASTVDLMVANRNVQNESHRDVQTLDGVNALLASLKSQVTRTQGALDDTQREITIQGSKSNYSLSLLKANMMREAQKQEALSESKSVTTHTSYAQLWAAMATAIDNIKSDYVDFYADLMQKYTQMYEAYNKHVQAAASEAVEAGKDGNHVNFNGHKMRAGYFAFEAARKSINLGSVKHWNEMSVEEQKSMTTTLEPAFKVSADGAISFNIGPFITDKSIGPLWVEESFNNSPAYPTGITSYDSSVSTVGYQAWLASFNAGTSGLQSNMQSFAQRYSQANSTFDNLNKVLSGSISSLADSARDVLKSLS